MKVLTVVVASVVMWAAGAGVAGATVRLVGPGHPYAKPCAAIAVSAAGDVVQIDAAGNGTYDGDVCASSVAGLTIEGVNGRARIDAAGQSSGGKAIWVLSGAGMVVRDVELSGAKVPDRNGSAIRLEGGSLTIIGAYVHGNEDGILVNNDPAIDLTIESTELADNGFGDGQSHNVYVGNIHHFTMRYSYSHGAKVGHLVKSRAAINDIRYNRLTGEGGTDSYELDLPNGGVAHVVGNLVQQGPNTENPALLAYGEEGVTNPDSQLFVVHNTFVNDRPGNATAIMVAGGVTAPTVVTDNISTGMTTFVTQASAQLAGNCQVADPQFADRNAYDYHLRETSPCREIATSSPFALDEQYVYNLGHQARPVYGVPDAGAFEWVPPGGGGAPAPAPAPAPGDGSTPRSPLSIVSKRALRDGRIRLTLKLARAGRLSARATVRPGRKAITYARSRTAHPKRAGRVTLTLRPTATGRRALRRHPRLTATIAIAFRPSTGATTTRRVTLKLRRSATAS